VSVSLLEVKHIPITKLISTNCAFFFSLDRHTRFASCSATIHEPLEVLVISFDSMKVLMIPDQHMRTIFGVDVGQFFRDGFVIL
jgi:hypothetical protein